VRIYTDSKYSISCVTDWCVKWQSNGWKTSDGKAVENRDIVEPIISRMGERTRCRVKTEYVYVKGHANIPGNVAADLLAVNGARAAQVANRMGP
jgi:ribonuclease HI